MLAGQESAGRPLAVHADGAVLEGGVHPAVELAGQALLPHEAAD